MKGLRECYQWVTRVLSESPPNLHSSPNCWHVISNTNIYIQLTHAPQIVGSIYPIQLHIIINVHFSNCGHHISNTNIHFQKRTFPDPNPPTYIHPPSVGMIYPIYIQLTYTPQIVGIKYRIQIYISENPNPVPEGHTEPLQLTFIPQVLA